MSIASHPTRAGKRRCPSLAPALGGSGAASSWAAKRRAPAFDSWFASFARLWRDFGANPTRYPDNFDEARRIGVITVGSPETVRREIAEQQERSGCTYFVSRFAYGDLTFEESARSLDLFAAEVMPHFPDEAARPAAE